MEQHPVPRQITTFEFKLIGFMTLKQFLYFLVFGPVGFIIWMIFPIPYLNIILGVIFVLFGAALALVPINDRPLDVWIKNLIKRLTSPTQYVYHKHNQPLYFLQNLYFVSDPHKIISHIESKEKLAAYLVSSTPQQASNDNKQQVQTLLQTATNQLQNSSGSRVVGSESTQNSQPTTHNSQPRTDNPVVAQAASTINATPLSVPAVSSSQPKQPFFIGLVKNNKKIPLPGILIYVKGGSNETLRLLKTNPHGVFATYNNLPEGEYLFELKDPKGGYFFDTMKLKVEENNPNPFEFYSKEML
ncbi:MAG: PrgI family protein [Candidatus Roizmanbacteria bacterium]|nr:MAG: PrgI family protein [Candidatus Roizmanbacteria bacterium]